MSDAKDTPERQTLHADMSQEEAYKMVIGAGDELNGESPRAGASVGQPSPAPSSKDRVLSNLREMVNTPMFLGPLATKQIEEAIAFIECSTVETKPRHVPGNIASKVCDAAYARARETDYRAAESLRPAMLAIIEAALGAMHCDAVKASAPDDQEEPKARVGSPEHMGDSRTLAFYKACQEIASPQVACANPVMTSPTTYRGCRKPDGHDGECSAENGTAQAGEP